MQLRFNQPQDPVDPTADGQRLLKGGVTHIEYDPADPRTFYFTMFEYGVFRTTGNGTTIRNVHVGPPDDGSLGAFLGIRYELAGADKSNRRNIMLSRNAGVLCTDMSGEAKDPPDLLEDRLRGLRERLADAERGRRPQPPRVQLQRARRAALERGIHGRGLGLR